MDGEPSAEHVCAVIVTYHPGASMMEGFAQLLEQVQDVVIVDNGSSPDEISRLVQASQDFNFQLVENNENLGLGAALNQGIRLAKSRGYNWVVLLDQDSKTTGGYVRELLATWKRHPQRARVASLHPTYTDPKTGEHAPVKRASDGGPVISMTSGTLMPMWIFDKIGWFMSEYFIDQIDTEFCYRIRSAGYLIADSKKAILLHQVGHPSEISLFGFRFRPTNHSAMRRYYISRNRIAVFRKYFLVFPNWILWSIYECSRETLKCFLGEENRLQKFGAFLLGTWDGLTGRMGKKTAYDQSKKVA